MGGTDQSAVDGSLGNPFDVFGLGVQDGLAQAGADPATYDTVTPSSSLFSGFSLPGSLGSYVYGLPLWAWIIGGVILIKVVRR